MLDALHNKTITILGTGTWGWALAHFLSQKDFQIRLWTPTGKNLDHLLSQRRHPRLPETRLKDSIVITDSIEEATCGVNTFVMAVASPFVRSVAKQLKNYVVQPTIISVTKGLEAQTALTMSEVIQSEIMDAKVCVLSGGSHAEEVIKGMPFALTATSSHQETAEWVASILRQKNVGIDVSEDIRGVEISAALKNIISIATGIADGQQLGDNFRSALITRGLRAIRELGVTCGANPNTFYKDCCLGDLLATAFSMHSRNRKFGLLIGQGYSKAIALEKVGMAVEGLNALEGALALAQKHQTTIPFRDTVIDIVEGRKNPKAIIDLILQ